MWNIGRPWKNVFLRLKQVNLSYVYDFVSGHFTTKTELMLLMEVFKEAGRCFTSVPCPYLQIWLMVWHMNSICSIQLGIPSSQLTFLIYVSEGWLSTTNQKCISEVATIYKAYVSGLCKGVYVSRQEMATQKKVLTYPLVMTNTAIERWKSEFSY